MTGDEAAKLLTALVQARADHPELASLLKMQEDLTRDQVVVGRTLPPLATSSEPTWRVHWTAGVPALTWEDLDVDWRHFHHLLEQAARVVAKHRPDMAEAAREFAGRSVEARQEAALAWYAGAEQDAIAAGLIAAALQPWLARAAEAVQPYLDFHLWRRGTCPICGGRPDLAFLEEKVGERHLCCARCDTRWPYARLGCPFCGNEDAAALAYYAGDDDAYRLYVCETCHGYLKTLDLRQNNRPVLPPVERILTLPLDAAAQERGYYLTTETRRAPILPTSGDTP